MSASGCEKRIPTWIRNIALVVGLASTWAIIHLKWKHGVFLSWFGPHVLMLVAYGWIIWFLAMGKSRVSQWFAHPLISAVGRSSFYPYLWHLPLIALVVIVAESLGFKGFFYLWWQPVLFLVLLYCPRVPCI